MLRSDCLRAIQAFLVANYTGDISVLTQEDDGDLVPPYALVRIASGEDIGAGQVNIWDFSLIVAVFSDANDTTIETAETNAEELFATLADPDAVIAFLATQNILASCWVSLTSEAGIDGDNWQHFHGFRLIASPSAP